MSHHLGMLMRQSALLLLGLLHLSMGHAAPAEFACGVVDKTYDSQVVVCVIPQGTSPRQLEFKARFSGGHDDTSARIETLLDEQSLPCDAGSKKDLFAEDGDVSLFCRFAINAEAARESRLKVTIRWSHAQYTDFQLADR